MQRSIKDNHSHRIRIPELLERIGREVMNHPVSAHLSRAYIPDYEAGCRFYTASITFSPYGLASLDFRIDSRGNDEVQEKDHHHGRMLKIPFNAVCSRIGWSSTSCKPREALATAIHNKEVAKLANSLSDMFQTFRIFDCIIEREQPPKPSLVDHAAYEVWVALGSPKDTFYGRTNEELRDLCKKHDLKVSGNKDELVDRLSGAVTGGNIGNHKKVETHRKWKENHSIPVTFREFDSYGR